MNVLLVKQFNENQHLLLPEVVTELRRLGLRSRLVHDVNPHLKHRLWSLGHPTFVVSMLPIRRFKPSWATLWQQVRYNKIQEGQLLQAAGIPVPKQKPLYQGTETDLYEFDNYVVVKPSRGGCGALVRVMRRGKARWRPMEVDCIHSGVNEALLVQEYIHTGPWPTSYRVGTVFGEPVYALRITADKMRKPILFERGVGNQNVFEGKTIVASSKGCTMATDVPQDVLDFAGQVHKVFPTHPLLGIDILRDYSTGRLYALEVNSEGWVFHFTNERYEQLKNDFGIDLRKQFGGPKAIARGIFKRLLREKGESYFSKDFPADAPRQTEREGVLVP